MHKTAGQIINGENDRISEMPLTRDFKETVLTDMRRNPGFGIAMLREGVDALLSGELDLAKEILRDYVNATIGFEELGERVGLPPKSLMRMLGPNGNPQANNLLAIIGTLQQHAGVTFHVAEIQQATAKQRAGKAARDGEGSPAGFAEPARPFKRG